MDTETPNDNVSTITIVDIAAGTSETRPMTDDEIAMYAPIDNGVMEEGSADAVGDNPDVQHEA